MVPFQNSRLTIATLLLASTMTIMAGATIAPSLPGMAEVFKAVPGADLHVRLVLTITALAIAVAAPLTGLIGDRIGRLKVLTIGVVVYILAGTAGLYLSDLNAILVSRILLGVGVAAVMTSTAALIGDLFQGETRGKMLGWQGAASGFGGVVFLGVGGLLAQESWRGPFFMYLIPLAVFPLIWLSRAHLSAGPQQAKTSAYPVEGSAKTENSKTIKLIYALAFFGMIAFYAVPVQFPFLLSSRGLSDPRLAGASLAGMTLVSALIGIAYGRFAAGRSPAILSTMAFGSMATGLLLIASMNALPSSIVGLALVGVGMGLLFPTLSGWLLSGTQPAMRGRVMGGFASAVFLGQFVSPLLLQPAIAYGGLTAAFFGAAAVVGVLATALLAYR